jgi:alpha-beta hydrolase superfamily lysophospholipase
MGGVTASSMIEASARDGTRLRVRQWNAVGEPWADVLLVHGLAEHSGRYEHVGRWLAAAGIQVTAYDLRGFGASGGRRAWVDHWSSHVDDLEDRLAAVRASSGGRPVVLYGHSLGGLLALGYAVAEPRRPLPDALVLSAPALESTIPAWKQRVAGVLSRVAPNLALANALDGEVLSRDPAVAEAYLADPLNQHRTTTRFGATALEEQSRVRGALDRLSIPTLVYHGEDDRLVPTASSERLGELATVSRRTYPKLRHESHNEPEGEAVVTDVVAWLRSVLQSTDN